MQTPHVSEWNRIHTKNLTWAWRQNELNIWFNQFVARQSRFFFFFLQQAQSRTRSVCLKAQSWLSVRSKNTLISLSWRTCTSANVLFKFKPETTAAFKNGMWISPGLNWQIPPAASFRSAVRRHEGQVVHNVRSGCLLPLSLWRCIKYVKSFGLTSL